MKQSTKEAYAEVDMILNFMDEKYREEIPKEIRIMFRQKKDQNYKKKIVYNKSLAEQELSEETLAILAVLNYNYWCKDDERKKELFKLYTENETKYQKELKEKTENIINDTSLEANEIKQEVLDLVIYKKPRWYRKIFNQFLNIFKKKEKKY